MANMVNMTNSKDGKQMVESSSKGLRTHRFVVMLTEDEVVAISQHRWENQIVSASEAARQLIKKGLEKEMPAPAGE